MSRISELFNQPHRIFHWRNEPATEEKIQELVAECPIELPALFFDLFRFANGFEADLALPPLLFVLHPVEDALTKLHERWLNDAHDLFFVFGGNGGLETIAFDRRNGPPYPIVMFDAIAPEDSAIEIAPDLSAFVHAIGFASETQSKNFPENFSPE